MQLKLFNTLKGEKDVFTPISPPTVGLYTCGPTVYNYAHIGNLRAYVFADVLRRTLEYSGYKVNHVMNITDIGQLTSDADDGEDKMVKALKREGLPMTLESLKVVADKYTTAFLQDLQRLNIKRPSVMPRASEHIAEDIELIQKLEAKGIAYKTSDGIYFDTSRFPSYGTRSGFKLGELKEGARVAVNTEKHNPRDFALWKFASGGLLGFQSPFGSGYPGWHIECSAMSRKYLGQPFDIHTGGIDHIPVHHQNEIAQSEAAYGVPLANVWMHNEFVNMGESKMAKSEENFLTLEDLSFEEGIMPLAYRLWLMSAHYRQKIEFSMEAVLASQTFYKRILNRTVWKSTSGKVSENYRRRFVSFLNDDLDTPKAISLISDILDDKTLGYADKAVTIKDFEKVLGLNLEVMAQKLSVVPEPMKEIVDASEKARQIKDFVKADKLREEVRTAGYEFRNTDSGSIIRKKL